MNRTVNDTYVELNYTGLRTHNGYEEEYTLPFSGSSRMWLSELPEMIKREKKKGNMLQIVNIREI